MFTGLHTAARAVFRDLLEIREELPWPHPAGGQLFVRLRPHDTTEYADAIEALGIRPRTALDRKTEAVKAQRKALESNPNGYVQPADIGRMATISGLFDQLEVTPGAAALGFVDQDRPFYSVDEIDAVKSLVAVHLVAAIEHERDGEVLDSTPGVEAESAFLAESEIPTRWEPGGPRLRMAGEQEGRALTAFVLRLSMEDERFRERLDPLALSSPTPQPGEAESEENAGSLNG